MIPKWLLWLVKYYNLPRLIVIIALVKYDHPICHDYWLILPRPALQSGRHILHSAHIMCVVLTRESRVFRSFSIEKTRSSGKYMELKRSWFRSQMEHFNHFIQTDIWNHSTIFINITHHLSYLWMFQFIFITAGHNLRSGSSSEFPGSSSKDVPNTKDPEYDPLKSGAQMGSAWVSGNSGEMHW